MKKREEREDLEERSKKGEDAQRLEIKKFKVMFDVLRGIK